MDHIFWTPEINVLDSFSAKSPLQVDPVENSIHLSLTSNNSLKSPLICKAEFDIHIAGGVKSCPKHFVLLVFLSEVSSICKFKRICLTLPFPISTFLFRLLTLFTRPIVLHFSSHRYSIWSLTPVFTSISPLVFLTFSSIAFYFPNLPTISFIFNIQFTSVYCQYQVTSIS